MVRGVVTLPHGTGKETRYWYCVLRIRKMRLKTPVPITLGLDDYIEKIEKGWTDVDVIITMPSVMGKVGKLGRVLGPRGLMPNPKSGTVTMEIGKAVNEVKAGKIDFKVDKYGIVHTTVGKASFDH
jgi:large subunit ribosomal protein L1